jgi:hypothetical protein
VQRLVRDVGETTMVSPEAAAGRPIARDRALHRCWAKGERTMKNAKPRKQTKGRKQLRDLEVVELDKATGAICIMKICVPPPSQ